MPDIKAAAPAAHDYVEYGLAPDVEAVQSEAHSRGKGRTAAAVASVLALALLAFVVVVEAFRSPPLVGLASQSVTAAKATMWHGVSLGGWLVMEINPGTRGPDSPMDLRPKWMYDEIEANSELDFVTALRKAHGDDYAIATMRNHWAGYITDDMLDRAKALGVDTVRLPVGYWIMDEPVGGTSPLEYGISPEGFVTGGLNHLKDMLVALKSRGMVALVDIHAMPCNSACVSDGLYCQLPLAFAPPGFAPIADMPRCGGGVYPTKRVPVKGEMNWGDVGVNNIFDLAQWIAELPEKAQSVAAFQLANEPVLGAGDVLDSAVNAFYERALTAARYKLDTMPLVLSFMGPTQSVLAYLEKARESHGEVIVDHHYYLNWQAPAGVTMPWSEIHRRACLAEAEGAVHNLDVYEKQKQHVIVGEWSLAVNHDAVFDLTDPDVKSNLRKLFKEQLAAFSRKTMVSGAFFWTLRMGSGWDPRPTDANPQGTQADGTSAYKSKATYPFAVWSLLEMDAAGIAVPLDGSYGDACDDVEVSQPWFTPTSPSL